LSHLDQRGNCWFVAGAGGQIAARQVDARRRTPKDSATSFAGGRAYPSGVPMIVQAQIYIAMAIFLLVCLSLAELVE
jgi:hypothetical protein